MWRSRIDYAKIKQKLIKNAMASFDIKSELNIHELTNAVDCKNSEEAENLEAVLVMTMTSLVECYL